MSREKLFRTKNDLNGKAMAELKKMLLSTCTLAEIGRRFGKHHSTIHYWKKLLLTKKQMAKKTVEKKCLTCNQLFNCPASQLGFRKYCSYCGRHVKYTHPKFDDPVTYNDYLAKAREKAPKGWKNLYSKRFWYVTDTIV